MDDNRIVCVQVKVKQENLFIPMNLYWYFWDSDQVVAIWRTRTTHQIKQS